MPALCLLGSGTQEGTLSKLCLFLIVQSVDQPSGTLGGLVCTLEFATIQRRIIAHLLLI